MTLTIKENDHCEDLEYGLWVSLSEKSFEDYSANFINEHHEANYFGWVSNDIAEYEFPKEVFPRPSLQKGWLKASDCSA